MILFKDVFRLTFRFGALVTLDGSHDVRDCLAHRIRSFSVLLSLAFHLFCGKQCEL